MSPDRPTKILNISTFVLTALISCLLLSGQKVHQPLRGFLVEIEDVLHTQEINNLHISYLVQSISLYELLDQLICFDWDCM